MIGNTKVLVMHTKAKVDEGQTIKKVKSKGQELTRRKKHGKLRKLSNDGQRDEKSRWKKAY